MRALALTILMGLWLALSVPAAQATDRVYYFHNDHLGTPQAMSNQAGAVVWTAEYDPFGQATVNQDPDDDGQIVVNNLRFPGQYYDAETGLHYNHHRDYDPGTGRYLTPDPIGIRGGTNHLYVYVQNNPLRFKDPMGLYIWICNRKTKWGVGNHAYFWNDSDGSCCGMGSTKSCSEVGPFGGDDCSMVPGSTGREKELIDCCKKTADKGLWTPPINDCHEATSDCLKDAKLPNPGAPGGRLGQPCDDCPR